ncbi:MAG: demethylmenaquinone methyltransferase / 2-methoxy-6-polyprenyl,4-benzoquinol methylase [Acidobacteriaceae bacterium]|jgi:demethylmenaquinone methyltransferase/2-methoxy-6-polyprenyl-1,4-benzoquinol methylase|nr:demethylmenaquinone methyltransferase / 2-methoxy-6-polyprenyl,4-benzoquinol methylase [Acidobacteriaceae bacterium]
MTAQARGAQPAGTTGEQDAAAAVQEMFDSIAPRYDLLNHILSGSVDRLWWWRTARRFRHIMSQPQARIADVCCGTGDMTLALLRRRPTQAVPVLAIDFSHQMLLRGAAKFAKHGGIAVEADALHLPIAHNVLHLLTTAFGFRNLANYEAGLREFYRVLAPGGELGILDFSEPGGVLGKLYAFYFRHVLPRLGGLLSGASGAYTYLPTSVGRFPAPPEMLTALEHAGFRDARWTPYTFGIAGLYSARKP